MDTARWERLMEHEQDGTVILVVDDEERIRDLFRETLETAGYSCLLASDGQEALDVLAREPVDLALLDIIMPGMSGTDLFHRMQATYPEVPVVFVTAMTDVDLAVDSLKTGAYDYITKPMRFQELGRAIERALDRKRARREEQDRHNGLQRLVDVKSDEVEQRLHEVTALNRSFRRYLDQQMGLDEIAAHMAHLAESTAADLKRLADEARQLADEMSAERDSSPHSLGA